MIRTSKIEDPSRSLQGIDSIQYGRSEVSQSDNSFLHAFVLRCSCYCLTNPFVVLILDSARQTCRIVTMLNLACLNAGLAKMRANVYSRPLNLTHVFGMRLKIFHQRPFRHPNRCEFVMKLHNVITSRVSCCVHGHLKYIGLKVSLPFSSKLDGFHADNSYAASASLMNQEDFDDFEADLFVRLLLQQRA